MALTAESVRIERGGRLVQADVSFRCPPGQAVSLRGPNGAGKTSLLRAIAGYVPIRSGRIAVAGASGRDDRQEAVFYCGHADGVKPQLTVAENLAFWAATFGGSDVPRALAQFDLGGISRRLAATCSAGQKRRLGLARMLVSGRPVWLLDEPSVSLDAPARAALTDAVRTHLDGGGIAVIATHDADLVPGETLNLAAPGPDGAADPFLDGAFG